MKHTVRVLLSTYNGERFLEQQLKSLLQQDYTNISIHIRDDGSTDKTPSILERYAKKYPHIVVERGNNQGVAASFLILLNQFRPSTDLFAFCDQDDIWHPDKLSRAVSMIGKCQNPERAVYFSSLTYVDSEINKIAESPHFKYIGFSNAIIENIITGCTAVIGDHIRQAVCLARSNDMLMHDWWIYLVGSTMGELVYDPVQTILYRQHNLNVSAWEKSTIKKVASRTRLFTKRFSSGKTAFASLVQAERFLTIYGKKIPKEKRELIEALIELRNNNLLRRTLYAIHPQVHRNRPLDDLAMRMLILLGQH